MVACMLVLKFTYVLGGWEGNTHVLAGWKRSASYSMTLSKAIFRQHGHTCPPGILIISNCTELI